LKFPFSFSMPIFLPMPKADRNLTGTLYGGDSYYRLCQEVVLGIGGVTHAPRARLQRPHALPHERRPRGAPRPSIAERRGREGGAPVPSAARTSKKSAAKCVFTTHTPVPAGHDRFPMEYLTRVFPGQTEFLDLKDASSADLMKRVLQVEQDFPGLQEAARRGASLNMTQLALNLSTYVNGVGQGSNGETRARCFRRYRSRPLPTGCNAAHGLRLHFSNSSTATFPSWRRGQLQFARRARAAGGGSLGGAS